LADAAEPYFLWLQEIAVKNFKSSDLNTFLMDASYIQLVAFVKIAQELCVDPTSPQLYDGIGRPYKPRKGLYFMLGWIVRDAPQQRLAPLISLAVKSGVTQDSAEQQAFAKLVLNYKEDLGAFNWPVIREVVADRLEGSRRSLKGKAVEAAVRSVCAQTFAKYRKVNGNFGRFDAVVLSDGEILIDGHAFDVCIDLNLKGVTKERIVMPVKSRETQGGGHANLFTRDIEAAMTALQKYSKKTGVRSWLIPVIVAENWHSEQVNTVANLSDELIVVSANPNAMESLPADAELKLSTFLDSILK
jgi:hypothetical protein